MAALQSHVSFRDDKMQTDRQTDRWTETIQLLYIYHYGHTRPTQPFILSGSINE